MPTRSALEQVGWFDITTPRPPTPQLRVKDGINLYFASEESLVEPAGDVPEGLSAAVESLMERFPAIKSMVVTMRKVP